MHRVRGLVDICGILSSLPIIRINTEHLVFTPDAFFHCCSTHDNPSISVTHSKGDVRIDRPFKSFFRCCDSAELFYATIRIPIWIFQKSSIENGLWYNRGRRMAGQHHTSIIMP